MEQLSNFLSYFPAMDFLNHPAFWIIVAAASEVIALTPAKSNSIVQLLFQALNAVKPAKK